MKEKILFVNSCVRGENESRTLALAKTALNRLDGDIEEIRLADANLKPLDAAGLAKRAESAEKNDFSDPVYDCAKQFAACDTVVIAAPFWDYSFPAFLKIYIESLCVGGLTFLYGSDGVPISYCRAKRLIYITTSGGYIGGTALNISRRSRSRSSVLRTSAFSVPRGSISSAMIRLRY